MTAYYNEIDPYAAQWLRNLIAAGHIAPGVVDERSIVDVRPDDLAGFTQCHFFAGIGGWSYAARLAGWPDDRPLWTGSCPCQPFSNAGKKGGFDDARHLWPVFAALIRERRPAVVFGEQVASATEWLRLVRGDLEALEYAVGAMPIQAASAGADHLRDRYWFVADNGAGRRSRSEGRQGEQPRRAEAVGAGDSSDVADCHVEGSQGWSAVRECPNQRSVGSDVMADADQSSARQERQQRSGEQCRTCSNSPPCDGGGDLAHSRHHESQESEGDDCEHGQRPALGRGQQQPAGAGTSSGVVVGDHAGRNDRDEPSRQNCSDAPAYEWVVGADGKARRVKPGIRLLAHGIPGRVGKLRGFGNAIDPRPAAEFIGAYLES